MIDLHTHTNESDGTCTPLELVDRARAIGLEALGISDHDTFAGYDQAVEPARASGLDLVCGIELSVRLIGRHRSIHMLAYFLRQPPPLDFRDWVNGLIETRRDRNRRLVAKLQSMGVPIELAEVERIGRTLTGRPHFARLLIQKGYAADYDDAFRRYFGESGPAFVERHGPAIDEACARVSQAGGLTVLAHPIRLGILDVAAEDAFIQDLRDGGLRGIEVYHSDHGPADVARYSAIAKKYDLAITGGSDFHGDAKPGVSLGTGRNGNLSIPRSLLDALRA
ncbi:MAG TPA: PHP domain-containing protein [Bryobacteraceae bacterium]|nr:PHP domain-containing protein [Bryobacteraceae bacterium]